ncbi:MAG: hypothetical protein J5552_04960 [Prevotella sp.]|nr:hypothetical protein [Prevotella sp.]
MKKTYSAPSATSEWVENENLLDAVSPTDTTLPGLGVGTAGDDAIGRGRYVNSLWDDDDDMGWIITNP